MKKWKMFYSLSQINMLYKTNFNKQWFRVPDVYLHDDVKVENAGETLNLTIFEYIVLK